MKYLIKETLMTQNKVWEKGMVVNKSDLPKKSFKWLLDQEIIVQIDDVDTEFEEVKGEEE